MEKQTWQEYGTPGTTQLTPKDVELAAVRLERFWQDAVRRAREVAYEREQCASSEDSLIRNIAATVSACGWLPAPSAGR